MVRKDGWRGTTSGPADAPRIMPSAWQNCQRSSRFCKVSWRTIQLSWRAGGVRANRATKLDDASCCLMLNHAEKGVVYRLCTCRLRGSSGVDDAATHDARSTCAAD